MISEAEQAVMKLKETEDTLQSQVAQNLDSEAHNRDGSDIEEEIREAFRVFDREGHGFIPVPDLTEVLL